MKRLFLLSLILLTFLAITSCENEDSIPDDSILGEWQSISSTETATVNEVLRYQFNNNGTLQITRAVVDNSDNDRIIGFRQRSTGTFSFDGSQLTIEVTEIYESTDIANGYSALENLVLSNYKWADQVSIEFREDFYQMIMSYPNCGIASSCIDELIFTRTYSPIQT